MTRHRSKLVALGALGGLSSESYGKSYEKNMEKMLSKGTLELFFDSKKNRKSVGQ